MRTIFLRTNGVAPDPRVEKEVNSLLPVSNLTLKVVAWDRTDKYKSREEKLILKNGEAPIVRFGIPASWGGGMKRNLKAVVLFETKLFFWLMKNHKTYDCIHACDLMTGLPAYLPAKLFNKKIVYDIFDYYAETQHGPQKILNIFKRLEDYIISHSDATIICSEKRKEQIKDAKPKMLEVIHNSPDIRKSNLQSSNINELPSITYVGNLVEDRCITMLLEIVSKRKDVKLNIGGFGELEGVVKEYSNKFDNIIFFGRMNYDDVLKLECTSDILVALYDPKVPNHKYAAPNKFYEALALGKPVIMFKNTGMDEIVEHNRIGVICECDTGALNNAITELISLRNSWSDMGLRMRKLYNEKYSWSIMENRLQKVYFNLMEIENEN